MPSLPLTSTPQPQALLRVSEPPSPLRREESGYGHSRVRVKTPSRPRSYHQIFEDQSSLTTPDHGQVRFVVSSPLDERESEAGSLAEVEGEVEEDEDVFGADACSTSSSNRHTMDFTADPPSPSRMPRRREDTARRSKRFSLPAVALQTTNVTARTTTANLADDRKSVVRTKRFSLVLSGRHGHGHGYGGTQSEMVGSQGKIDEEAQDADGKSELGKGVAAGKLSELLGRKTE